MAKKNLHKAKGHQKEQKEFEEEVLQINRVTRVVKGGRRLRFRATVAIGDRKGRVGLGVGKASEVITGIKKAVTKARKNLIKVPITKSDTIPHEVNIKYKAAHLLIIPASSGTGVIAGGALRKILHLAGVKNVLSKSLGSRNTLITAQASIKALKSLRPVRESEAKKFEQPTKGGEQATGSEQVEVAEAKKEEVKKSARSEGRSRLTDGQAGGEKVKDERKGKPQKKAKEKTKAKEEPKTEEPKTEEPKTEEKSDK